MEPTFAVHLSDFDLSVAAQELLQWYESGLLPHKGQVRQLADKIAKEVPQTQNTLALRLAEQALFCEITIRWLSSKGQQP